MKKTAGFIFVVAAVIAFAWGIIEILLNNETDSASNTLCHSQANFQKTFAGQQFVAADAFRLLMVDPQSTVLSEFKWDGRTSREIARLKCDEPHSQCLVADSEPGAKGPSPSARINWVRHLNHGAGILSWQTRRDHQQILPFFLSADQKLSLSSPLRLCESEADAEKLQYFLFGTQLVAWNPHLSSFEVFELRSFPGTSPRAAPRRADQIWQIRDLNPQQTSCAELIAARKDPPRPLRIESGAKGIYLRSESSPTDARVILLRFIPDLGLEDVTNPPLSLLNEYGPLRSSPFVTSREEWLAPDFAIRIQSRRALSSLRLEARGPQFAESPTLLSGIWWRWARGPLDQTWVEKTGNKIWIIEQQGADLHAGSWTCDNPQFVKTNPTSPVIPW